MLRGVLGRAAVCAALLACAAYAHAQSPPTAQPSADDRRAAGKKFAEGESAFRAGELARAGDAFEAAYALAPHPDALWNAARAWERAGDAPRAAALYERWLVQAPADSPDRKQGEAALAALGAKVGRITIEVAAEATDLRLDGQSASRAVSIIVRPGEHEIRARIGERELKRITSVAAGGSVTVTLRDEPSALPVALSTSPTASPAPTATPSPTAAASGDAPVAPKSHGWHPAAVWIGGGVTLFSAGWTVWSGLDTLKARDDYLATPDAKKTQLQLDEGKKRQLRTNFLLGFTVTSGLFTSIVAVFLVDWKTERPQTSASLGVGPGSVSVRGRF